MSGRALRAFTRTRFTHRFDGRCRCAVGLSHSATVEVTTDTNDVPLRPEQGVCCTPTSVFVSKFRRKLFTDPMLTLAETTMRTVCAALDVELVEFNGEADHVHLLVANPQTLASRRWCTASKAARPTPFAGNSPAHVCAATRGRRPTSPSPAAAHPDRSSSNTSPTMPNLSERRAAPGDTRDGLTPP